MAIFLPFTRSWTLNVLGPTLQPLPSTSMYSCRVPSGRRSPTLIVIAVLLVGNSGCCGCDAAEACERHPGRDEEAADAAIHEPDVQWHPEFMDPADPTLIDSRPLLRAFLAACAGTAQGRGGDVVARGRGR